MGARLRGHKTNLVYTKLATFRSMKIFGQDYTFFRILSTRGTCSLSAALLSLFYFVFSALAQEDCPTRSNESKSVENPG
jgi:hypothetical protein